MTSKNVKSETIELKPIEIKEVKITIEGDTPLIIRKFSEKAKQQILDIQTKKAKTTKEARDPWADMIDGLDWLTPVPEDKTQEGFEKAIKEGARFGFPACGLKQSAISAAYRSGQSKDKVSLQGVFHIPEEFIEIEGVPEMREDYVKIPKSGAADLAFRGEFKKWKSTFTIRYISSIYSLEQIINFINLGGFMVGIGCWRPERSGTFGTFHVVGTSNG